METVLVCIMPPLELRQQLRKKMEEYSRELRSYKALKFPPKITLVNRFRTDKYEDFVSRCKDICARTPRFQVTLGPLGKFQEPPILYLAVENNEGLQALHEELVELSVEFLEPWVRPRFKDLSVDERQRGYLHKYGNPFVKEYYEPHITFAGPDVDADIFAEFLPEEDRHTILADKIYILRETQDGWKIDNVLPLA